MVKCNIKSIEFCFIMVQKAEATLLCVCIILDFLDKMKKEVLLTFVYEAAKRTLALYAL
jgi:hypothetical protein